MTCEECRRLVGLEVDDDLADEDRARVSGHLLSCGACSRYREEIRAVAMRLDAVCLPIREEADEIGELLPVRKPGHETVPIRRSGRWLWGVLAALLGLLLVAIIAAAGRHG